MKKRIRACIRNFTIGLIAVSFMLWPVRAQITGNFASAVDSTHYGSGYTRTDPIYIYCSPDAQGNDATGSLTAVPPGGIAGWDFEWTKYNSATGNYDSVVYAESDVPSSTVDSLGSGGYAVRIRDAASLDTLFYAWVFIDTPFVSASVQNFTCDYVALKGEMSAAHFVYYDPGDNTEIILQNGLTFRWSSIPESDIPFPTIEPDPITYSPPYEDTWYYLTVIDSFSCMAKSSVFYKSIHVKADFEPVPSDGEAPLEVEFLNKSINGVSFEWKFGDDSVFFGETPDPHTYYIPGEYKPVLIAESAEGCIDSIMYESIKVDPSELHIPNAFSPNNDGYNDRFRVAARSLRYIHVRIYNRHGAKVYDFEGTGDALHNWEGWDGKINGHGDASPGVYYYIIRAVGWDDVEYKGDLYRGFVYLFRER